ncbi:pre-B-cell leukemia transcription factor-interacting protein 1 isoform X3 [Pleurodeles waltl]|uniref:pre-B-cell leukemia transcription factor-interacting protein 1 isoform X3 n=1 Tax=Pleurodeles waltl TaxID=8319 RepID=UPI00370972FD
MAEHSDSRAADNNWVMASTEGFVVETVGPEQEPMTAVGREQTAEPVHSQDPVQSHGAVEGSESSVSSSTLGFQDAKEPEVPGPHPAQSPEDVVSAGSMQKSAHLEIPPEERLGSREPDIKAPSLARKADEDVSCSSSEDDVEGLRKRQVREVRPAASVVNPGEGAQAEGETWLTLNKCIVAALALVGLGLLVVSGTGFDAEDGVLEPLERRGVLGEQQPSQSVADIKVSSGQDWMKEHLEGVTGDPKPLQAMSEVLDRLAKENQDIRRMQAELQAQKEELQALLNKSEGEKISVGYQQQNLLDENLRLKESLLQEETTHLSVREELEALKEKVQVWEKQGLDPASIAAENTKLKAQRDAEALKIEGFLAQKEMLVAEAQMLRQELDKQRTLLGSIRQDLENLTSDEPALELDPAVLQLRESLVGIGSKLKSELQRSETWEKNYVKDQERRREKSSFVKKGRSQLNETDASPNTSASPEGKPQRSTQSFGSTSSPLKESTQAFMRSDRKDKWKEAAKDWKEGKHKKHAHSVSEDESMHKRHHLQDDNDPQEHKSSEFVGRKNEWKGIVKEGKWRDRVGTWREGAADHHHSGMEKRREDQRHQERPGDGLHHHKEHHASLDGTQEKEGESQQNRPQRQKPVEHGKKEHRHHDHNKFWKKLSDHQYRVPEGCSGVKDCARKDGMDLFNVELAPVDKQEFTQLLREYLELQELAKYLPELDQFLGKFFESDIFMHDKMRFRDFVNDVEDYLEDIAAKEKGDDDAVDDFDKHVFKHYFGDAAIKKRSSKKSIHKTKTHKNYDKDMGPLPQHGGPKNVKSQQRMKEEGPCVHHKLPNPLNHDKEMKDPNSEQHHNSGQSNREIKVQSDYHMNNSKAFKHPTEWQSYHKCETSPNENMFSYPHDNTPSFKTGKSHKERQSNHQHDDTKPFKNKGYPKDGSQGHRHADVKSVKNEKNMKEIQYDQQYYDAKLSQNEKSRKLKQSDHQDDYAKPFRNEKNPKERSSTYQNEEAHSFRTEKINKERSPDHHNRGSTHKENFKERERTSDYHHHESTHKENFKQKQSFHHHDDAQTFSHDKDSSKSQSHQHHHRPTREKYYQESHPHHLADSQPFNHGHPMKEGEPYDDSHNFHTFNHKDNLNKERYKARDGKHSRSNLGKHKTEDQPRHQYHDDPNNFPNQKYQKEARSSQHNHQHGGSKAYKEKRPSYGHNREEYNQKEEHSRGR